MSDLQPLQILERVMHAEADGNASRAAYWRAKMADAERRAHNAEPKVAARRLAERVARAALPKRAKQPTGRALRRALAAMPLQPATQSRRTKGADSSGVV